MLLNPDILASLSIIWRSDSIGEESHQAKISQTWAEGYVPKQRRVWGEGVLWPISITFSRHHVVWGPHMLRWLFSTLGGWVPWLLQAEEPGFRKVSAQNLLGWTQISNCTLQEQVQVPSLDRRSPTREEDIRHQGRKVGRQFRRTDNLVLFR